MNVGMRLRSTTVWGYSRLWLLAKMRRLRRLTWRYGIEQRGIEEWLGFVGRAEESEPALAREIVLLSGLIKGYSDTARHGELTPDDPAALVAEARHQALADPDGAASEPDAAPAAAQPTP
jgi:indolepyruvate ferredoxin oxidoreductase beta subunit